jgi:hypothetical protein
LIAVAMQVIGIRISSKNIHWHLLGCGFHGLVAAAASRQQPRVLIKWSIEISSGYSKSMSTPSRVVILALCVIWVMIFLATLFMKIMREPRFSAKSGFSLMMLPITYALWKQGFVRAGANTDIYILFQPIAFAMLSMERIVQTDPEIKIFQRKLPFVLVFLFCHVHVLANKWSHSR